MKDFGIIGNPLSHSHSPAYFKAKFEIEGLAGYQYHLLPIDDIFKIHHLMRHYPFLEGLNVTAPYKQSIIEHLHRLDPLASAIGSVNVIKVNHTKDTTEMVGYNTDAGAFQEALVDGWKDHFRNALVFGNGGVVGSISFILNKMNIPHRVVSRQKTARTLAYQEITGPVLQEFELLINATPVGSASCKDQLLPLPYHAIDEKHYLMDLIYNPDITPFLQEGRKRGAKIKNGKTMFVLQAEKSWAIWNDK